MSVIVFIKDKTAWLNCLVDDFLAEIFDKTFKIRTFTSKMAQNLVFLVHFV